MGIGQGLSIYFANRLGSGQEIFNPFKFDTDTNSIQPNLFPNPTRCSTKCNSYDTLSILKRQFLVI